MKNRKLYMGLAAMLTMIVIIGLSINGRALSVAGKQLTLPRGIKDQPSLPQGGGGYSGYTRVTDDEEKLILEVPQEWSDIETGIWNYQGKEVGRFVAASGDLGNFYAGGVQAGVMLGVSNSLARTYSQGGLLDMEQSRLAGQCTYQGRLDYENPFYHGQYDQFTNCAGGAPDVLVFTTSSADQKTLILLRISLVSGADVEAANTILSTFQVLGDPERDDHYEH